MTQYFKIKFVIHSLLQLYDRIMHMTSFIMLDIFNTLLHDEGKWEVFKKSCLPWVFSLSFDTFAAYHLLPTLQAIVTAPSRILLFRGTNLFWS